MTNTAGKEPLFILGKNQKAKGTKMTSAMVLRSMVTAFISLSNTLISTGLLLCVEKHDVFKGGLFNDQVGSMDWMVG